ncbi:MAG TPA: type II toxin-antitoxin system prevent-host-death family antitoxin [Longimicrobium sp.]|nr:type II toxin-antitoxin system prevent-host-death family antitoxin [Longimicrobium sp.]
MKRIRTKGLLSERFPGRRIIPAGEFKPVCLKLMDQVNETGVEIVITKRNEPIAKLVPITGGLRPFVGRSRGVIQITDEDLLAPIAEDWEVDADL